jgi:CheY-like chemotaxis protein
LSGSQKLESKAVLFSQPQFDVLISQKRRPAMNIKKHVSKILIVGLSNEAGNELSSILSSLGHESIAVGKNIEDLLRTETHHARFDVVLLNLTDSFNIEALSWFLVDNPRGMVIGMAKDAHAMSKQRCQQLGLMMCIRYPPHPQSVKNVLDIAALINRARDN